MRLAKLSKEVHKEPISHFTLAVSSFAICTTNKCTVLRKILRPIVLQLLVLSKFSFERNRHMERKLQSRVALLICVCYKNNDQKLKEA